MEKSGCESKIEILIEFLEATKNIVSQARVDLNENKKISEIFNKGEIGTMSILLFKSMQNISQVTGAIKRRIDRK